MPAETDTQTPEPAAPGASTPALGTGEQTDWRTKAEEWQRRFTGLQGAYQREQGKLADLGAQVLDLNTRLTGLTGEKEALTLDLEQTRNEAAGQAAELARAQETLDRLRVIALDFPQLLPYERDGLLPAGLGDELRGKLARFAERLQAQGLANTQRDGGTPPAPNPAPKDRGLLMGELRAAQAKGDRAAYDAAYSALLELGKP